MSILCYKVSKSSESLSPIKSAMPLKDAEEVMSTYLPSEIFTLLNSKTSKERVEGLRKLNEWIRKNSSKTQNLLKPIIIWLQTKLKNNNEIKEFITTLKTCCNECTVDEGFITDCIHFLIKYMNNTSLLEECTEVVFEIANIVSPTSVAMTCIEYGYNSDIVLSLLTKMVNKYGSDTMPIESTVEYANYCLNSKDEQIRTLATQFIITVYEIVGDRIKPWLNNDLKESIDKSLKESLIRENLNITESRQKSPSRLNISNQIILKIVAGLNDNLVEKRQEAKEALEKIFSSASNKILPIGLMPLMIALKGRIDDPCKKLAKQFTTLIGNIALAIGSEFSAYSEVIIKPLLFAVTDIEATIRFNAMNALEKIAKVIGSESILNHMAEVLIESSSGARNSLLLWLLKNKTMLKDCNKLIKALSVVIKGKSSEMLAIKVLKEITHHNDLRDLLEEKEADYLQNILNTYNQRKREPSKNEAERSHKEKLNDSYKSKNSVECDKMYRTVRNSRRNTLLLSSQNESVLDKMNQSIDDSKGKIKLKKTLYRTKLELTNYKEKRKSTSKGRFDSINKVNQRDESSKTREYYRGSPSRNKEINTKKPKELLIALKKDTSRIRLMKKRDEGSEERSVKEQGNESLLNCLVTPSKFKGILKTSNKSSASLLNSSQLSSQMLSKIFINPNRSATPLERRRRMLRRSLDERSNSNGRLLSPSISSLIVIPIESKLDVIDNWSVNEKNIRRLKQVFNSVLHPKLLQLLFSIDSKQNIAGISLLSERMEEEYENMLEISNLLFKWITTKQTNIEVFRSAIRFLERLFTKMKEAKYKMRNREASTIIPMLCNNLGTDNYIIKIHIKKLIELLCEFYKPIKIGRHFMEALDITDNNKVKLECLKKLMKEYGIEELLHIINMNNIVSLINTNLKMLIKDGALNFIREIYKVIGESIWNHIRNIDSNTETAIRKKLGFSRRDSHKSPIHSLKFNEDILSTEKQFRSETKFSLRMNKEENKLRESKILLQENKEVKLTTKELAQKNKKVSESIKMLKTGNISQMVNALMTLNETIMTNIETLVEHVNELFIVFAEVLKSIFNVQANELPIRFSKYFVIFINKICTEKLILRKLNDRALSLFIEQILDKLLFDHLNEIGNSGEGKAIIEAFNNIVLRVSENGNPTRVLISLLNLLNKYNEVTAKDKKIAKSIIKCVLKLTNVMGSLVLSLDIPKILLCIHNVLENTENLRKKLRVAKTIITELVNVRGRDIWKDYKRAGLTTIKEAYIRKWMHIVLEYSPFNDTLCDETIFRKLKLKETFNEGIKDLKGYIEEYPEDDIRSYLVMYPEAFEVKVLQALKSNF